MTLILIFSLPAPSFPSPLTFHLFIGLTAHFYFMPCTPRASNARHHIYWYLLDYWMIWPPAGFMTGRHYWYLISSKLFMWEARLMLWLHSCLSPGRAYKFKPLRALHIASGFLDGYLLRLPRWRAYSVEIIFARWKMAQPPLTLRF